MFYRVVVVAFVVCLISFASVVADDEPIRKRLETAKAAYQSEQTQIRKSVQDWFDKREATARSDGNKKLVEQIKADREAFYETDDLPAGVPTIIKQKAAAARKTLEGAYTQAVKEFTKLKKDAEAEAIEKEWKEFGRGAAVNLLELVKPSEHSLRGEWKKEDGVLVTPVLDRQPRLQLPYEPGDEYDVELTCKRVAGKDSLCLGLVAGGRQVLAVIDAWPDKGYLSGLDFVDGKDQVENITTVKGPFFKQDKEQQITASVRSGRIEILIDGKPAISFKGEFTRLTLNNDLAAPNKKALFLHMGPSSSFQISRLVVYPVKGKGAILK
jgi:hypothetical protein